MSSDIPNCFRDDETIEILQRLCSKHEVDERLLRELCALTDEYAGSGNKRGISADVEQVIDAFRERQQEEVEQDVPG